MINLNMGEIATTILSVLVLTGILAIFREMRHMNLSTAKLQQWSADHEKVDNERFGQLTDNMKHLAESVSRLRDRMDSVAH